MRLREFIVEGPIGRLIVGPSDNQQLIVVDDHAMDQTINRMVLPSDVDRVLKKLHTVSDKIGQFEAGHKFWVYDPELDVALGFRSVRPGVKYKLNTVVGDQPYDGETPVVKLNEGVDFTNAVNSIEKLIRQRNIEFTSYEEFLKFVASRKFLQAQRNDQQFVDDVARAVLRRLQQTPLNEINDEDELSVSQRIQDYFVDRGYKYLGDGRDQIAFLSPRGTVVKVLGIGEDEREDIVKSYVGFFSRNQRNPHYPRIYNAGDFTVDGETYFVYEMEYLNPVSGEGPILEYLEDLMSSLDRDGDRGVNAFRQNRTLPPGLSEPEVDGLVAATYDLDDALGGQAPLDLRSIENLGRRKDGQIVIIDPYSL
jgi:hypothetical protein